MSISSVISTTIPWLTTALTGGPVGLAAKAAVTIAGALGLDDSSVSGITSALSSITMSGDQKIALQTAENSFQLSMRQAGYANEQALAKFDLDQISAVNATIQVELANAQKETWLQKSWRPLNGITVAAGSFVATIAACLLFGEGIIYKDAAALNVIPQLATSIAMILAVPGAAVGITAWHKGVADSNATTIAANKQAQN